MRQHSERLLAKSPHNGTAPTIWEHTAVVMDAVEELFGLPESPTRLGLRWLKFFKLDDFGAFFHSTLAAAALHDWGKANEGFQNAVRRKGEQNTRHEHLSGLMMGLPNVNDWFAARVDIDWDIVLAAVISHHLQVSYQTFAAPPAEPAHIRLLSRHDDFKALLESVSARLSLPKPAPEFPQSWSFRPKTGQTDIGQLRDDLKRQRLRLLDSALSQPEQEQRRRLLWAVRSALIAADAAGSALLRTARSVRDWIRAAFDPQGACTAEYITREVIEKRVKDLCNRGRWRGWNAFQDDAARLPERSLLLAPCGSGKTLAAWRWIARHCDQGVKCVIFLYPTRATATEGFRDYVSWAPETDAALIHGTAEYDLEAMFKNPDDPDDPRRGKRFEVEDRLFALGFWQRSIFSATIDQFFGFLQYGYASMCLLPLLADSVVVVDEVHSLDRGLFSALKDFLNHFHVPVICMTASLPKIQLEDLETSCGLRVYGDKPGELRHAAGAPRYRVQLIQREEVAERIRAALRDGRRVMWVLNQVSRAQDAARQMSPDLLWVMPGVRLYCYHSRFRLKDRNVRHQEVVRAFQGSRVPVLAVTTQVCEMSLDLDADLLVTEFAPITALIQRMGRCNRSPQPRDGAGEVLVYRPESEKPYDRKHLAGVDAFLEKLAALPAVSQSHLESLLARYGPTAPDPPKFSRFLESGPYAMAGEESLRDIEEFTVSAILDSDIDEFLACQKQHTSTAGLVLPVPRRFARPDARVPRYLAVVPHEHYDPAIGFCERPIADRGDPS